MKSTSALRRKSSLWLALAITGAAAVPLIAGLPSATAQRQTDAPSAAQAEGIFKGKTLPSKEYELSFDNVGKVSEVFVEPGQLVKAGDPLMRQDDRSEQQRLKELKAEANVDARIKLAEQRLELATVNEKRVLEMDAKGAIKQVELDEARINRLQAETQIVEEQRNGEVAGYRVNQLEVMLDQKLLKSPATGIVQIVDAQVGEISGPQKPAVKLVTIDPIEIETLEMPTAIADRLKVGDAVEVRYEGEDEWHKATVKYIDPVGNYTVGWQTVRLTMPNPEGLSAGRQVEIRIPQQQAGA